MNTPDLILYNGKITTLDSAYPEVSAVVIAGGRIAATGGEELLGTANDKTQRIDLKGRRVIPGLNDSHMHVIRGGLSYNWSFAGTAFPPSQTACACSRSRRNALLPANGFGSSAAGANFNSPSVACPRSRKSTPSHLIRRFSSCTCIAAEY